MYFNFCFEQILVTLFLKCAVWIHCCCVSMCSSCVQGGAPAKVHLHMWVRVWLWVRAVCRVCLCVCARMSGWNMWVFVGELDDFCRHWFTPGHPCPGLLKTCWVLGIGNGAQLQDHAKAPWGLTGVADADKVRKSAVFYVDSKNCVWVFAPRKCCHCSFSLSCCYPEKISVDFYQTNTCTQTN